MEAKTVGLIHEPAPTGAQDARVYCVAPDGTAGGDGSRARSFPRAKTAFERVGGGKTVILRPGIYRGPNEVPLSCQGSRERPTVLQRVRASDSNPPGTENSGGQTRTDDTAGMNRVFTGSDEPLPGRKSLKMTGLEY
jgi:hypothetical protein